MRFLGVLLMCGSLWAGDWVMFSDGKDTYIYSNATGEIYIRHHMGKNNYEDVFVKMPRGTHPNELKGESKNLPVVPQDRTDSERLKEMQLDALKKSQDMLNTAIE